MSFEEPSPVPELAVAQEKTKELPTAKLAQNQSCYEFNNDDMQITSCHESSEDDMPILARRQLREPSKEPAETVAQRAYRSVRDNDHNHSSHGRASTRQISKPAPKMATKGYKKSGPKAWATKPIMKNDMTAKKAVIREIEGYWGKDFIKSYIPKCHRPLVKRGKRAKCGKRSKYRNHETDPREWLPSVLKAILMIAKLTNNKKWLQEAMNDVVRHRIKHTGNRKPQLVTTDFDVIEDMLVKQWDVDYAFEIRYKHLLINRKDQEETDEDIDRILQVASDQEEGSEEYDDSGDDDEDCKDQNGYAKDENDEDEAINEGHDNITAHYLHSSGYTKGPLHALSPVPREKSARQTSLPTHNHIKSEQPKLPRADRQQQQPLDGYNGPIDPWGRPISPYGGSGYYPRYGGHYGYSNHGNLSGPQYPARTGRRTSQQSPPIGMHSPHYSMMPAPGMPGTEYGGHLASPLGRNKHSCENYGYSMSSGTSRMGPEILGYPVSPPTTQRPKIKRESPALDDHIMSVEDLESPTIDLCSPREDEEEADIDAELEAAQLELKIARLRAKKAAQKKSK